MLLINKSKRTIANIDSMKTVTLEDKKALKLLSMYGGEIEEVQDSKEAKKARKNALDAIANLTKENETLKSESETLKNELETLSKRNESLMQTTAQLASEKDSFIRDTGELNLQIDKLQEKIKNKGKNKNK